MFEKVYKVRLQIELNCEDWYTVIKALKYLEFEEVSKNHSNSTLSAEFGNLSYAIYCQVCNNLFEAGRVSEEMISDEDLAF